MDKHKTRRRSTRIDLNPPEVGILDIDGASYISGTAIAQPPQSLFVDILNKSTDGVAIKTKQKLEPKTTFDLQVYNKAEKRWEISEATARWIGPNSPGNGYYQIGSQLHQYKKIVNVFENDRRSATKKPNAMDYDFFRQTALLKSVPREAVCPLLNCMTYQYVPAGQRFITQGATGDRIFIIQRGTCVVNVEKNGELTAVARLRERDVVGEMAILTDEPRSAHVDAESDMDLWVITKYQFEDIASQFPELRTFLTELLTQWFENRTVTAERKIGKYLITDIIGQGGYSTVYRGLHKALKMPVAVKMMKHSMAKEPDFINNFQNEAQTIARFNHENIVKVYDIEERYQTKFIVMEHLEGMSLRKMLQKLLKLPLKQVVKYILQICSGLQYAHERGVIHQDIKPGNIFILPDDKVKILDFGLACPCGSENFLTGTPFYMSPEQVDCLPVDERTDIYAVGLTAYEMLTGERPFEAEDPWQAMDLRLKKEIPDPAKLAPYIPAELRRFILKSCSRDIDRRYRNVREAMLELEQLATVYEITAGKENSNNPRAATLFLMYEDKHQPELSRMIDGFCAKMQAMGVTCKSADFRNL